MYFIQALNILSLILLCSFICTNIFDDLTEKLNELNNIAETHSAVNSILK